MINGAAPPQTTEDHSKIGHGDTEPFSIAREPKIRINVVANPERQLIHVGRRLDFLLVGKMGVLQNLNRLVGKIIPIRAQNLQCDLNRQITLNTFITP